MCPTISTRASCRVKTHIDKSLRLWNRQDMVIATGMPRKDKPVSLALDPDLLAEVDEFIRSQEFPPTKRQVFEAALRAFLDAKKGGKK